MRCLVLVVVDARSRESNAARISRTCRRERMRGTETSAVAAAEGVGKKEKAQVICADCRNNVSDGVSRRQAAELRAGADENP